MTNGLNRIIRLILMNTMLMALLIGCGEEATLTLDIEDGVIPEAGLLVEDETVYIIDNDEWDIYDDNSHSEMTTKGINNALAYAAKNGYEQVNLLAGEYLIQAVGGKDYRAVSGGIDIPSNITLKMTDETYLLVEANRSESYNLLRMLLKENIKIIGGNLVGDIDAHNYSDNKIGGTHEFGYGINISGSTNIELDGINIEGMTGDGIYVGGYGLLKFSDKAYVPSTEIIIENCRVDGSRRNNISITGADGVLIKNNIITNAGVNKGTLPMFGIDVEANWWDGEPISEVKNIVIDYNVFEGNVNLSAENHNGDGVIMTNNIADNALGYGENSRNTVIESNLLVNEDYENYGIHGAYVVSSDVIIRDNEINGFKVGMLIRGTNILAEDNQINDSGEIGIYIYQAFDSIITRNQVTGAGLVGIKSIVSDGVLISNNSVKNILVGSGIDIVWDNDNIAINDNEIIDTFNGIKIGKGSGYSIKDNTVSNGKNIEGQWGIAIDSNRVNAIVESNDVGPNFDNLIYVNTAEGKVSVLSNVMYMTYGSGVYVRRALDATINGNHIQYSQVFSAGFGIVVDQAGSKVVNDNNIESVSEASIYASIANNCTDTNTSISANEMINGGNIFIHEKDHLINE